MPTKKTINGQRRSAHSTRLPENAPMPGAKKKRQWCLPLISIVIAEFRQMSRLPNAIYDPLFLECYRVPMGVFSGETPLRFQITYESGKCFSKPISWMLPYFQERSAFLGSLSLNKSWKGWATDLPMPLWGHSHQKLASICRLWARQKKVGRKRDWKQDRKR